MAKIKASRITQKAKLVDKLTQAQENLNAAVAEYNSQASELYTELPKGRCFV